MPVPRAPAALPVSPGRAFTRASHASLRQRIFEVRPPRKQNSVEELESTSPYWRREGPLALPGLLVADVIEPGTHSRSACADPRVGDEDQSATGDRPAVLLGHRSCDREAQASACRTGLHAASPERFEERVDLRRARAARRRSRVHPRPAGGARGPLAPFVSAEGCARRGRAILATVSSEMSLWTSIRTRV